MQHTIDNWTGGQVRFFWLTTLPHFPLFVKRLTLIVSPRCECRRDMRWNTATGKVTQISQRQRKTKKQIKRKPRKKQLFQTRLQAQRKDKPPPGECELYLDVDCSNLSYNSRPSATVLRFQVLWLFLKYQTWKPGVLVLQSLTHYSEPLKTWRGSSSCRQLCNRTLAGPSLTRLVATSLSFLSCRDLSYLIRKVWPPPSSPSWTARQPARPSWLRPSAEMLTPSALSLNDKWEAFDDDSHWF